MIFTNLLKYITYINSELFLKSVLFLLISMVLMVIGIHIKYQITPEVLDLITKSRSFLWLMFLVVLFISIILTDLIFFISTFEKAIKFGTLFLLTSSFTVAFYFYFFNINIIENTLYFQFFVPFVTIFMCIYCARSIYSYYQKIIYKTIAKNDSEERLYTDEESGKRLYVPSFELKEHRINKSIILLLYPNISRMPWGAEVIKDYFLADCLRFYDTDLVIDFDDKKYIIKPISQEAQEIIMKKHSDKELKNSIRIIPNLN